jgi:hypothetical protein
VTCKCKGHDQHKAAKYYWTILTNSPALVGKFVSLY